MGRPRTYAYLERHLQQRHEMLLLLLQPLPHGDDRRPLVAQPLEARIPVFEELAAGYRERMTAPSAFVQDVEQAVEQILDAMYRPYDGTSPLLIPRDAWLSSPLMRLLVKVTYWLYRDDLISLSDAARLLSQQARVTDNERVRVRYLIQTGTLRHYWRPGYKHPQGAVLVRRSEVLRVHQRDTAAAL